jgi:hypothetical protein
LSAYRKYFKIQQTNPKNHASLKYLLMDSAVFPTVLRPFGISTENLTKNNNPVTHLAVWFLIMEIRLNPSQSLNFEYQTRLLFLLFTNLNIKRAWSTSKSKICSAVNPDLHPGLHHFGNLVPHPYLHPHQTKIRIRIRDQ